MNFIEMDLMITAFVFVTAGTYLGNPVIKSLLGLQLIWPKIKKIKTEGKIKKNITIYRIEKNLKIKLLEIKPK